MSIKSFIKKYKGLSAKIDKFNAERAKIIKGLSESSPYPVGAIVEVVGPVHKGKMMEIFSTEFIGVDKDNENRYCWVLKGYVLRKDGVRTSHIAESWGAYEE